MMSAFPSEAWFLWAVDLLNQDAQFAQAAQGWVGDFGLVVDRPEGGSLGVFLRAPAAGRLAELRFMAPDELEDEEPAYFASASQADWWALIEGRLDPIAGIVQKRLVVRGDLAQLIARLHYRGLAERWLQQVRRGG